MVQTKLTSPTKKSDVAEDLAKKQREISISEFFTKNRHLLGFDNPRKALLTTIKEAVDNALDACEEMRILPELYVEVTQQKREDRFKIIIEDNGPGIVKEQIPKIFAKLLYGSKFFSMKCTRGQQGIGICMSPDTLVPLANGDIKEIKEIVDSGKKEDIFVLRPDLKLSKQRIDSFFKTKAPKYTVKLNVLGGKKIDLSPENPVLVKTEYGLDWKRADCLSEGEYVAVAKTLNVQQQSKYPYLLQIINTEKLRIGNPQFTAEVIKKLRKKYGSFNNVAKKFRIKKDQLRGFTRKPQIRNPELKLLLKFARDIGYKKEEVYEKATRVGRQGNYINIPTKLCPKLFRFAGLIAGDGNIQKKRDDRWGQNISFWNNEANLLHNFKQLTKELFGTDASIKKDKRNKGNYVSFSSTVIADLLEKMGIPPGNKSRTFRIPPLLLKSPDNHIVEYIRALFDAEGSVSEKRGEISLMLTNKYVLKYISILLLRFGVHSRLNKARDNARIVIAGKTNVALFKENIGFTSTKQTRKLKLVLKKQIKSHPNLMVYPKMGRCIINAEKALGISHYTLNCGQARTGLLQGRYMSHDTLSKVFSNLMAKSPNKPPVELQEIYSLLNSHTGWSKITGIEFVKPKYDYIYDITMSKGNNFVANGIIVHNSAAAMYGQLTTGKPIQITSKTGSKRQSYYYELQLDTKTNEPHILKEEMIDWDKKHGTKIELEIEAKYQKGKQSIDDYLKQTAISNPHAHITYKTPENETIEFPRATKELPKEAKEIKPHPYGIELGILIKMLQDTRSPTLQGFLTNDFCRVSPKVAKEICEKAKLYEKARPGRIARQEADNLMQAIKQTKIMAPPTSCIVPIGEDNITKGLKKEVDAEFYVATTRPPSVYRGNPFQVECCTGDTKIQLENGRILPIKEYVESEMLHEKVFSMNDELKIVPSKVQIVHKFKNQHKILKITTKSGRTLKLTANNEIPIIENGEIIWKKVEDAMAGEFVGVPRIIKTYGNIPHLLDILDPNQVQVVESKLVMHLMDKLKKRHGSYKAAASKLEINYETFKAYKRINTGATRPNLATLRKMTENAGLKFTNIKDKINSIRIIDTNFTNPHTIKVPKINEDILYILGLLNSDGHISRKGIYFTNIDKSLHLIYREKIKSLFGLRVKNYNNNVSALCNKSLYLTLKELEKILPTLPNNLIISWLKGFADGDGWVSKNERGIKEIGIATAKREKAELVQTLLLRLGITSKIEKQRTPNCVGLIGNRKVRTRNIRHNVHIRNLENIRKFHTLISFRQIKRSNTLSESIKYTANLISRSNHDTLPLGNSLYELRKENHLFQYELGFSDHTIRQVEHNNCQMSRTNLQQMLITREFSGSTIEKLNLLAFSDILWDKIIDIELVPHEEYVYDLTVETGNFVADNIIMHNCGIAYGGTLPADDLVRVIRFANRVPLQYQQSACAITKSIMQTAWKNYGLSQSRASLPAGPALIMVHIASVWVPFTSESKEAVANYPEIIKEIKLALQECGRKLASYIRKVKKVEHEKQRQKIFEMYIKEVAESIHRLNGSPKGKIEDNLLKIAQKRTAGNE